MFVDFFLWLCTYCVETADRVHDDPWGDPDNLHGMRTTPDREPDMQPRGHVNDTVCPESGHCPLALPITGRGRLSSRGYSRLTLPLGAPAVKRRREQVYVSVI